VSAESVSMAAAVARLEQAVAALGAAVARPRRAASVEGPALPEDMVPMAEVQALSARLDAALAALHAALMPEPALASEED
jgi:hypothetical protein